MRGEWEGALGRGNEKTTHKKRGSNDTRPVMRYALLPIRHVQKISDQNTAEEGPMVVCMSASAPMIRKMSLIPKKLCHRTKETHSKHQ